MKFSLLFLALFLSACSKLSVGVYWADTLALSQIDDFITLESEQKGRAKEQFRNALAEVRRNEFPKLADLLDRLAGDVESQRLNAPRIAEQLQVARALLFQAGARFEALGMELIEIEAAKGFERFDSEFRKRREKWAKKIATEEDRIEQAQKRVDRVIDATIEELTPEQEALVAELFKSNPLKEEHESRAFVFAQFQKERGDPGRRRAFVQKYFREWDSLQSAEYLKARELYQRKSIDTIVKVLASATREQRRNVVENLRKRAIELRKLTL